jgi:hypothetical protein
MQPDLIDVRIAAWEVEADRWLDRHFGRVLGRRPGLASGREVGDRPDQRLRDGCGPGEDRLTGRTSLSIGRVVVGNPSRTPRPDRSPTRTLP